MYSICTRNVRFRVTNFHLHDYLMKDLYVEKTPLWTQFSHCDPFIRAILSSHHDSPSSPTSHLSRPLKNTNILNQGPPRIQNRRHLWPAKRIHRFGDAVRISSSSLFPSFSSSGRSIIKCNIICPNTPLLRQCCACPEGSFYLQVVSCSQSLLFCSWKLVEETIKIRDEGPICSQSLWNVSDPVTKQN